MARAGAVWLPVLPDMSLFNKAVASEARVSVTRAGKLGGAAYGKSFATSAGMSLKETRALVEAEVAKSAAEAERTIRTASARLGAARKAEADAAGRVRLAEGKLNALREGGKANTLQLAGAEERLASSQRGAALAAQRAAVAQEELGAASKSAAGLQEATAARMAVLPGRAAKFGASASGALTRVGASARHALGTVAKLGAGLGAFAGAEFLGHGIKQAADFQQQMNLLVVAAGESKAAIKGVSDGILGLATTTGTSTEQLSEGMYTIEKAGFRGANGLKILKASAQGAKAENTDLAVMTNAVTSAMTSYHLKAGDANKITNEMIAASGRAKTSMQTFAGSLSTVLPIASAAGLSFSQVGGAIATLTNHGTSAEEATQELANTIRNLQAPNNVAVTEMARFGLNANDVSKNLGKRGLTGTLEELSQTVLKRMGPSGLALLKTFNQSKFAAKDAQTEFSNLGPATQKLAKQYVNGSLSLGDYRKALKDLPAPQASLLQQFVATENRAKGFDQAIRAGGTSAKTYTGAIKAMTGGATGLNTTLQLTGENTQRFQANVKGIAAEAAHGNKNISSWGATQKTFNVQLAQFKEAIEVAGIRLGTVLLPKLLQLGHFIGGTLVPAFMKFYNTALKPVFDFMGAHTTITKDVALGLGALLVSIMAFEKVRKALKAFNDFRDGVVEFSKLMKRNPQFLIIAAIVALGIALVVAYKKSATFRRVVQDALHVVEKAGSGVAKAFEWIKHAGIWGKVIIGVGIAMAALAVGIWAVNIAMEANPIVLIITGIIAAIALLVVGIIELVKHFDVIIGFFTKTIPGAFEFLYRAIKPPVMAAVHFIEDHWKLLVEILLTALGPIGLLAAVVLKYFGPIKSAITTAFNAVKGAAQAAWPYVVKVVQIALTVFKYAGEVIYSLIVLPFVLAWIGIRKAATAVWGWIGPYIMKAIHYVVGVLQHDLAVVEAVWRAAWNGVKGAAVAVWNAIVGFFRAAWSAFQTFLRREWQGWINIAHAVWNTIGGPIKAVWNALSRFFHAAWSAFQTFLRREWQGWVNIAHAVWNTIGGPIKAVWNALSRFFHTVWGAFAGYVTGQWHRFVTNITRIWGGITGPVKGVWNRLRGWFSAAWNGFKVFVGRIWGDIVDKITGAFDGVADSFNGIWRGIKNTFVGAINGIIKDVLNPFISFISKHIPGVNIPTIPLIGGGGGGKGKTAPSTAHVGQGANLLGRNAMGGRVGTGGMSWVGEQGPEIMQALPGGGVRIYPTRQAMQMAHEMRQPLPGYSVGGFFNGIGHGLVKAGEFTGGKVWTGVKATGGAVQDLGVAAMKALLHVAESLAKTAIGGLPGGGFVRRFANGTVGAMVNGIEGVIGGKGHKPKTTGAIGDTGARSGNASVAQAYARSILGSYGWGPDQMAALLSLWNQESGWNAYAVNPSSGAYGIPQALGHGHVYNLGDFKAQIQWGLNYIRSRYHTPASAWAHEQGFNWYANGTGGAMPGWAMVGEKGPELVRMRGGEQVLNAGQTKLLGYATGTLNPRLQKDAQDYAHSLLSNITTHDLPSQISAQLYKVLTQIRRKFSGGQENFLVAAVEAAAKDAYTRERTRLANVGHGLIRNVISGIGGWTTTQALSDRFQKIDDTINANFVGVQHNRLIDYVAGVNKQLTTLANQRDALAQRISDANSFFTQQKQGATDYASLSNLADTTSVTGIVSGMQQRLADIKNFTANLRRLAGRHLSQNLLNQLFAAGPDQGGPIAAVLVKATGGQLSKINRLQGSITGAAGTLATAETNSQLGGNMARNFIAGLQNQKSALQRLMTSLGHTLARSVGHTFGVKGYATGGTIPAGHVGITGEHGIELVHGPGTITPHGPTMTALHAMGAADRSTQVLQVFIGDEEITDRVDLRVQKALTAHGTALRAGRRRP